MVDDVFGDPSAWREARTASFTARGERLCRRIYGRDYEPMMKRMQRLHPDLAEWILQEGYGKTLARSRFDAKTREELVIPVLVALRAWRQLPSHVAGVINVGGTRSDAERAVRSVRGIVPDGVVKRAEGILERTFLRRVKGPGSVRGI